MRRWYDDACGTAMAMELIGERWSLLIVRELMFGPRRYSDLKASLTGISANVLTQRLDGLAHAGVLLRRQLPAPARVHVYELTPWGYDSERAIQELGRWAVRSPMHDPSLPLSAASLMMSARTMYAGGMSGRVGFRLGHDHFVASLTMGTIDIARADDVEAAAETVFEGSPEAVAAVIYGGKLLAAAEREGALRVIGNRDTAAKYVTCFPLPAKIIENLSPENPG